MIVKMLTTAAGPKFQAIPGEDIEVSHKQGKELIAGGFAEPVGKATDGPATNHSADSDAGDD